MDTIFIREFRVDAWVGIYEWEKQRAQTLEMEIEIGIPGNEVGRTDNIHDTVHYGEVVQRISADLAVVHRVVDVVGASHLVAGDADLDLHLEGLRALLLPLVDSHPGVDAEFPDEDRVHGGVL